MTDLLNDNVIPLLEAIGWTGLRTAPGGELYGISPEGNVFEAVPPAMIENFTTPGWYDGQILPRLWCLVETSRGNVTTALYRCGTFETEGGEAVEAKRWLPWKVDTLE